MAALTLVLWIYLVIVALVLLFSVLSNMLVIYCVIRFKSLRTVTHVLISSLAVSDILLAGFIMPQRLHDISHEQDFYEGEFLCRIINFGPVFIITCSIYALVCVSFERYRAIIDTRKEQWTFSSLYKIIPIMWTFSVLVSVPSILEYSVNVITIETGANSTTTMLSCGSQHMSDTYSMINAVFVTLVSYVIPVVVMLNNYFHLALFVWKTGRTVTGNFPNDSTACRRARNRIKVVKLLTAIAVIFAVSWLPFFVMQLYAKITNNDASDDAAGLVNLFLMALAAFSTAYNVVLYVAYNPRFAHAIKIVLRIKHNRRTCADGDFTSQTRSEINNIENSIRNGSARAISDIGTTSDTCIGTAITTTDKQNVEITITSDTRNDGTITTSDTRNDAKTSTLDTRNDGTITTSDTRNDAKTSTSDTRKDRTVTTSDTPNGGTVTTLETRNNGTITTPDTRNDGTITNSDTRNDANISSSDTWIDWTITTSDTWSNRTITTSVTSNDGAITTSDTSNDGTITTSDTANNGTITTSDTANDGTITTSDTWNYRTITTSDTSNDGTITTSDSANDGTITTSDTANDGTMNTSDTMNDVTISTSDTLTDGKVTTSDTRNDWPITTLETRSDGTKTMSDIRNDGTMTLSDTRNDGAIMLSDAHMNGKLPRQIPGMTGQYIRQIHGITGQ